MKQLLDANKRTDEANKRFEEANKRSEEANRQLREENKELKDMINGLKLDIENMKAYSPYWGQSLASQSQPQSYESVARSGSNSSGSAGGSPKSVSFSSSDSSPRSSMRSILRTASEQGMNGSAIVVELQGSELADTEQARSKFTEVLRATEGLEELEFLDFKMFARTNSKSVRIVATKQEELIIRRTAETWTLAIQGARLVAPKWYPIKVVPASRLMICYDRAAKPIVNTWSQSLEALLIETESNSVGLTDP
ncbi:hypothetical protein LTR16_004484 [Cryomyces antarcticus]|uniref:Uncharacterized protein n=1 Tax=Cryomyces antarcticus TaxID=329879 RepID=A0ABR0M6D6_9PEZI|nr:hypothetical protein LTR16_004484 [Cryomyces antarcticus]